MQATEFDLLSVLRVLVKRQENKTIFTDYPTKSKHCFSDIFSFFNTFIKTFSVHFPILRIKSDLALIKAGLDSTKGKSYTD